MYSDEMGQVLRTARKSRKLSQRELARRLRMSPATISNLERGSIQDLGFRKIERICDTLGLALQIVSKPTETFESSMDAQQQIAQIALSETEAILAHIYPNNSQTQPQPQP
jgi:transcriptional regulator with XRE-family HTH domain